MTAWCHPGSVCSWAAGPVLEASSVRVMTLLFKMLEDVKAQLPLSTDRARNDIGSSLLLLAVDGVDPPLAADFGRWMDAAVAFCEVAWPVKRKKSLRMPATRRAPEAARLDVVTA
jgi:hypothetical protein